MKDQKGREQGFGGNGLPFLEKERGEEPKNTKPS